MSHGSEGGVLAAPSMGGSARPALEIPSTEDRPCGAMLSSARELAGIMGGGAVREDEKLSQVCLTSET